MTYRIEIKNEARIDINQAAQWYEDNRRGLGEEFIDTVLSYFEYLSHNAHTPAAIRGEFRELLLKRFPYIIVYRIVNESNVVIISLIHTSRHPAKRKKRK